MVEGFELAFQLVHKKANLGGCGAPDLGVAI
jgi:hypothetical protein